MSEEKSTPKEQPIHKDLSINIEKGQRIEGYRNYSDSIGDLQNKSQGQYAKPFINEIIQPTPGDKGNNTPSTKDTSE